MAKTQKVVIVIPTYNEKDNIGRLIAYLCEKIFPDIDKKFDMHVLVVDDSSPDGTGQIVEDLSKKLKNIHLLKNKQKMGLGGAYISGMSHAVDKLSADILFEMDADFSHDPKVIPDLLQKIEQGNDLVLGSRYIKGGSIPQDWGFHRKFLSIVGNLVVRIIITHFAVKDWTTGYRAIRKKVFEDLRQEMHRSEFAGYTFQIGFLHKTIRKGYQVAEVPIHFIDREFGKSKIGSEYIKNTLHYIITIRITELKRVIKFGIVGAIGFIVNFTALEVFYKGFNIPPHIAAAMGAELAIISNFIFNNVWTFKERKITKSTRLIQKFIQFNLASLGAIAIQYIGVWLGTQIAGEAYYQIYFVASVGVSTVVNFVIYNTIIWNK